MKYIFLALFLICFSFSVFAVCDPGTGTWLPGHSSGKYTVNWGTITSGPGTVIKFNFEDFWRKYYYYDPLKKIGWWVYLDQHYVDDFVFIHYKDPYGVKWVRANSNCTADTSALLSPFTTAECPACRCPAASWEDRLERNPDFRWDTADFVGGNYTIRVALLNIGSAWTEIDLTTSVEGSLTKIHRFHANNENCDEYDYALPVNGICRGKYTNNLNPTWCNNVNWIEDLDWIKYTFCLKGPEICDGVDNDCDGAIDEYDSKSEPPVCQCEPDSTGPPNHIDGRFDANIDAKFGKQFWEYDKDTPFPYCTWRCKAGFFPGAAHTPDENKCLPVSYSCPTVVPGGTANKDLNYEANQASLSWLYDDVPPLGYCSWDCKTDYMPNPENLDECILKSSTYSCAATVPGGTANKDLNYDSDVAGREWDYDSTRPLGYCSWDCKAGFIKNAINECLPASCLLPVPGGTTNKDLNEDSDDINKQWSFDDQGELDYCSWKCSEGFSRGEEGTPDENICSDVPIDYNCPTLVPGGNDNNVNKEFNNNASELKHTWSFDISLNNFCSWRCKPGFDINPLDVNRCILPAISCNGAPPGKPAHKDYNSFATLAKRDWNFDDSLLTPCSWRCIDPYYKGSGADENNCVYDSPDPNEKNSIKVLTGYAETIPHGETTLTITSQCVFDVVGEATISIKGSKYSKEFTAEDCLSAGDQFVLPDAAIPINGLLEVTFSIPSSSEVPCEPLSPGQSRCSKTISISTGYSAKNKIPDSSVLVAALACAFVVLIVGRKRFSSGKRN